MIFSIKPPALIVLKYLSKTNIDLSIGNIKTKLASQIKPKDFDSIFKNLKEDGYISISKAMVSLTEKSKNYLKDYDDIGKEYIFKDQLDNAILRFLYEIDCPIRIVWFPKVIIESSPSYSKDLKENGSDLNEHILHHSSINRYINLNQDYTFSLKPFGRDYYKSIMSNEQKQFRLEEMKFEQLEKSIRTLQDQIDDFKPNNFRANAALIIAGISMLATILIEVLKGCK